MTYEQCKFYNDDKRECSILKEGKCISRQGKKCAFMITQKEFIRNAEIAEIKLERLPTEQYIAVKDKYGHMLEPISRQIKYYKEREAKHGGA